jgi:hypothetical protein
MRCPPAAIVPPLDEIAALRASLSPPIDSRGSGELRGGAGDDFFSASGRTPVECGSGRDSAELTAASRTQLSDCEHGPLS